MIGFWDFIEAFNLLGVPRSSPVIAHTSLSAFGYVEGGAQTLLEALTNYFKTIVMPGFTYKTMLTPETGPENNGLLYGHHHAVNLMAQFFSPDLPVDRLMGSTPEALRNLPGAARSCHPILSFVGINAAPILEAQSLQMPLNPIRELAARGGWVLLLGVGQTVNTSLHYAEYLAGRRQFVRWALVSDAVVECPGFPGCSDGFDALSPWTVGFAHQAKVGASQIWAAPLEDLISAARSRIEADALALLCERSYCDRCEAVRAHVRAVGAATIDPILKC